MIKALKQCNDQELYSALSAGGLVAYRPEEVTDSLRRLLDAGQIVKREGRWCSIRHARSVKDDGGSGTSGLSAPRQLGKPAGIRGVANVKGKPTSGRHDD